MKQTIEFFNQVFRDTKHQFDTYLKDESIPLVDRFYTWLTAPKELHNHGSWICHDDGLMKPLAKIRGIKEVTWYDDFHKDRYATVDLVDLLLDHLAESIPEEVWDDKLSTEQNVAALVTTNPAWTDLAKYLVEQNLGSFIHDW